MKNKEKNEILSHPRSHVNQMQRRVMDESEQEEDINGKTGEIQIESEV